MLKLFFSRVDLAGLGDMSRTELLLCGDLAQLVQPVCKRFLGFGSIPAPSTTSFCPREDSTNCLSVDLKANLSVCLRRYLIESRVVPSVV